MDKTNAALHGDMAAMMADDGDDDTGSAGSFLQGADGSSTAYLQDSADALTNALGSRWNGRVLEADAKQKTDALLKGIAGHNSLGAINRMMGAMQAIR